MICPNCGILNDDKSWKCFNCQAELQAPPPEAGRPPEPAGPLDASFPPEPVGPPEVIPNYLWQAIVCTACCFLPLGIPAIVYAAQVSNKLAQGDFAGARRASNNAKMWCWISFGAWIVSMLCYFYFSFFPALSHIR